MGEKNKLICINDTEDSNNDGYEPGRKFLLELFEEKYPEKSSFEKIV
jgi:hypothetical protein